MSDLAFRFLHASDFRLDQPPSGLTEIPEHLRDVLLDGPYRAAEQVFDTAVSDGAQFVVLTGDLLDLTEPSARGLSFLLGQFERLAAEGISVYWSSNRMDVGEVWPTAIPLPDCVHVFGGTVESRSHENSSGFNIRLLGRSGSQDIAPRDFSVSETGQYTIALGSGRAEGAELARRDIDYWALGGQLDRKTLFSEPHIAHYSGTPQGRSPQNIGPHGCTLIELRRPRETRLRFVPCDVMRWQHERVIVSAAAAWNDIQDILAQRVGDMRSQTPTIPLLVRWTLSAVDGTVDAEALQLTAAKASTWLKKQYGYHSETCWPVSVTVDAQGQIPAASYEEDTLLGDYLRAVRAMRQDQHQGMLQSPCIPEGMPGDLHWLADMSDASMRNDVLREAASLGAALLRGEKAIGS